MAADTKRPNPQTGAARRHSLDRQVMRSGGHGSSVGTGQVRGQSLERLMSSRMPSEVAEYSTYGCGNLALSSTFSPGSSHRTRIMGWAYVASIRFGMENRSPPATYAATQARRPSFVRLRSRPTAMYAPTARSGVKYIAHPNGKWSWFARQPATAEMSAPIPSSAMMASACTHRERRLGLWEGAMLMAAHNAEVSDGGGQQTPESANRCRPPPFAQPKS